MSFKIDDHTILIGAMGNCVLDIVLINEFAGRPSFLWSSDYLTGIDFLTRRHDPCQLQGLSEQELSGLVSVRWLKSLFRLNV